MDFNREEYIRRVRALNEGAERRAYVFTFGCQQNEADSEKVRGLAREMGYVISDNYDGADLIIINTCAIREHAEMKALSMLGNFKAEKRKNPELVIGVIGCMASEKHIVELIKTKFHYVSFTLEPNMLHKLPELIYNKLIDSKRSFILGEDDGGIVEGIPTVRGSLHRAWVSIMYGCNNFCSYCIVPYTRGRERSRKTTDIIKECCELISSGVKEITLLGQNVNSYKGDVDFAGLLKLIAKIDGDFLVRFMTSHPKDVSPELIKVMSEHSNKIAPYFHLPLQSGSNKILRLMHRTYTKERFLEIAKALRDAVPGIALSTDVIVGFPEESDEDFRDTLDVIKAVGFDNVYAFRYSKREGTPAARMTNQVPDEIVDARMEELLSLADIMAKERNDSYLGRVERVLVDSISKKAELGTYSGRTATNKLVHFTSRADNVGKYINVRIDKVGAYELIGEEI